MSKSPHRRTLEVCIVSAHPLVLEEFRALLPEPDFHARTIRVDAIPPPDLHQVRPRPSLFVVDAYAPVPAAAALVGSILEPFPHARALAVAEHLTEENGFALLRARARGLLTYSEARQRLPEACKLVAAGGLWAPRAMLSRFVDWNCSRAGNHFPAGNTNGLGRSQAVLAALLENLSNKEIANRLHMSERTVKFHISRLLAAYHVRHRTDLILLLLPYKSA